VFEPRRLSADSGGLICDQTQQAAGGKAECWLDDADTRS